MLINERFTAVFPSLVRSLGGDIMAAAVLQAVHYRLQMVEPDKGQRWVKLSMPKIADEIGISTYQAQRTTTKLRDLGLLVSEGQTGRQLLWSIDYVRVGQEPTSAISQSTPANPQSTSAKSQNSPIYKNSKEVKEILAPKNGASAVGIYIDTFRDLHQADPPQQSLKRLGKDAKQLLEQGRPADEVLAAAEEAARSGHANINAALTRVLSKGKSGSQLYAEVALGQ